MDEDNKPIKLNWLRVKEPLRASLLINTVDGPMEINMHEASDNDIDQISKLWPLPSRPMREVKIPVEKDGVQKLETKHIAEDNENILKEWNEKCDKILEQQAMAFVDACLDEEDKVPGESIKDRVLALMEMPRGVRVKLVNFAQSISEKRLVERFEEAKK